MKKTFCLVSALALGLFASGANAADIESNLGLILSGKLAGYAGYATVSDPDDELDDDSYFVYGGSGVLSVPLTDMISVQADLIGERNSTERETEGAVEGWGLGGHLSYRDPSYGLIGLFGGIGDGDHPGDEDDQRVKWLGLEGQYYMDDMTLYAQAAWLDVNSTHDALDSSKFFVRGAGRYFFDDNFSVQSELAFAQGTIHGDTMDVFGWGLKTEYALEVAPVSLTAEYRGTYGSDGDVSATEHAALVGFAFHFGAHSLKEQDRQGATLETPTFVLRTAEWASLLD